MTSGKRSKELRKTYRETKPASSCPIPSTLLQRDMAFAAEFTQVTTRPIASPDDMAAYALIDPAIPQQIMAMAKQQQELRHYCEKVAVDAQARSDAWGQGGVVAIAALAIFAAIPISIYGGAIAAA